LGRSFDVMPSGYLLLFIAMVPRGRHAALPSPSAACAAPPAPVEKRDVDALCSSEL